LAAIARGRGGVQEGPCCRNAHGHVRESKLDCLKLLDGFPELTTVRGVAGGVCQRRLSDAHGLRRDAEPAGVERLHGVNEAQPRLAEKVVLRHAHLLEVQLHGGRRAEPHLVFLLSNREARQVRRDHERADASRATTVLRRVGTRHDEDGAGVRPTRHPRMRPAHLRAPSA
jgi:hypothetical protein